MEKFSTIIRLLIKIIFSFSISAFIFCYILVPTFFSKSFGYKTSIFVLFHIFLILVINGAIWGKGNIKKISILCTIIIFFLFIALLTMGPD